MPDLEYGRRPEVDAPDLRSFGKPFFGRSLEHVHDHQLADPSTKRVSDYHHVVPGIVLQGLKQKLCQLIKCWN